MMIDTKELTSIIMAGVIAEFENNRPFFDAAQKDFHENFCMDSHGFIFDKRTRAFYCGSINDFFRIKIEHYRKIFK